MYVLLNSKHQFLFSGFFGYKLFKSLTERERKKEEKARNKQSKKKK